jgi:hypothetical protein
MVGSTTAAFGSPSGVAPRAGGERDASDDGDESDDDQCKGDDAEVAAHKQGQGQHGISVSGAMWRRLLRTHAARFSCSTIQQTTTPSSAANI